MKRADGRGSSIEDHRTALAVSRLILDETDWTRWRRSAHRRPRPTQYQTSTVGDGTITTTSDALGRTTAADFGDATPDLTWTYDKASRPTTITDGLSFTLGPIEFTYDKAGRILTRDRGTNAYSYAYDVAGRVVDRTYPNGADLQYT